MMGGGIDWEFGIDMCVHSAIFEIDNQQGLSIKK